MWQDIEMRKEKSAAPPWMIQHMRVERQSCDTCSPPPKFKVEVGEADLPAGSEVSYGVPFRWSSARILAKDLRNTICGGHHNKTVECRMLLNVPEWTLDKFLGKFTGDSEDLLSLKARESLTSTIPRGILDLSRLEDGRPDEDQLWDGPDAAWIACNQANGTCYGGMSKEEWYGPKRGVSCVNAFQKIARDGLVNSSSAGLDMCNLNGDMDRLCLTLKSAQTKVFEGNCIFKGACSPQVFVYTPGMYSVTNGDFARGAVSDYYEIYNRKDLSSFVQLTNEEKVCPSDSEEIELKIR